MAPRERSRGDGIFLSYRRSDSPGHAGRLRDFLVRSRPHDQVFMDVDSIRPGTDFSKVIHSALESTAVMLVVIGPGWLSTNADGSPRLSSEEDFVRIEVEAALTSDVVVIPVLVEQAKMPDRTQLPEALRPLAAREAFELRDNRWDRDVADLGALLDRMLPKQAPRRFRPRRLAALVASVVAIVLIITGVLVVPRWREAQREQSALAGVRGAIPPTATNCRVSETARAGVETEGVVCDVPTSGSTLELELHRVTGMTAARTNVATLPDDRPGTCRTEPSTGGPSRYGNWGRGGFVCRAVGDERTITWLDEEALVLGRLVAKQAGTRWVEVAETWRQAVGSTPFLTLAAALPSGLDGCNAASVPDTTATTSADLECSVSVAGLTTVRTGLSPTREAQERYVASFQVTADIRDEPDTCDQTFPNQDPWWANQGESVRGRHWCFLISVSGKKRVRSVWTDEKLLVTYVVEDQSGDPISQQKTRVQRYWDSLLGNYPRA